MGRSILKNEQKVNDVLANRDEVDEVKGKQVPILGELQVDFQCDIHAEIEV